MKHEEKHYSAKRASLKEFWDESIYSSMLAKRFRRFINWLYSLLINGFFGKLFTLYSTEEALFFNCRFYRMLGRGKRVRRVASDVKLRVAEMFENSRILKGISDLSASLVYRQLKTYGAFLLSLGSYGLVTYFIRVYVLMNGKEDLSVMATSLAFLLISFPLMLSKDTFSGAAQKSRLMRAFLFEGLGIPRDTFAAVRTFPKRYSLVTALGMVFGGLTYFFHPAYYVMIAVSLLIVALIFSYPEIGILGILALIPTSAFFDHPSAMLFAVVAVTGVGYCVKLIRGKRVSKMGLIDAAILLFAIVTLLGGLFSAGKWLSLESSTLSFVLLLSYFLTVNLIRTREWIHRCVRTVLLFSVPTAIVGLVQIFNGSANASWIDTAFFADIGVRITATFDNPNIFAEYLLMVLPFAGMLLLRRGALSQKLSILPIFILLVICLVETWSRGAWLGALLGGILFLLIYSRRSVAYLMIGGAMLPAISMLLPDPLVARFASIGSAADSSSLYRISAWRGALEMLKEHWIGGVGVGEAAFSAVYPAFAYAGIESIHHTHNLYLQILSELGIGGLLIFLSVVILFIQNCFEFIYKVRNLSDTATVVAGLSAVLALLIMGLTDHIWYSYRIFLMFWMVIGLVNAYIRVGLTELSRSTSYEENSVYSVNFDLNVDNL